VGRVAGRPADRWRGILFECVCAVELNEWLCFFFFSWCGVVKMRFSVNFVHAEGEARL
jgi:hypothetical protein